MLVLFLYITAISFIFVGIEIIMLKKELNIPDRLASVIFMGGLPKDIKTSIAKPKCYQITGKYKKTLGIIFLIAGFILYTTALINSKFLANFI